MRRLPTALYAKHKVTTKKRSYPETALQLRAAKILNGLEENGLLTWFHTANESGMRSFGRLGKMRKAMGVKSGVPDIIILFPEKKILFIELKHSNVVNPRTPPENKLSESQYKWKEIIEKFNYDYEIVIARNEIDLDSKLKAILKKWGVNL